MTAETDRDRLRDDAQRGFIATLSAMADRAERDAPGGSVAIATLVNQLDERAFGLLIFLLALPCLVPAMPGAQIIAIPIFLLALQLLFARTEPWLPGWFLRAQVKTNWLRATADFAAQRLAWAERIARPRLTALASGFAERVLGLILALAALTIMLPITNTVPSLGVTLIAMGLIQRDGVFALLGAAVAFAWLALVIGVIAALATGAGFAVSLAQEHAPWLAEWLGQ